MRITIEINELPVEYRKLSNTLKMLILMSAIFLFSGIKTHAQQQVDQRYQIALKSRTFLPAVGVSQDTIEAIQLNLNRIKADPLLSTIGKTHVLVQLERIPKRMEKEEMKRYGIEFLNYIPGNTWIIAASQDIGDALSELERFGLRWVGNLTPADKSSDDIKEDRLTILPDNMVIILVQFHNTVSLEVGRSLVTKHGGITESEVKTINSLFVRIPLNNIDALLEEDFVIWAEEAPLPLEGTNDGIRAAMNVNVVNASPYNLDGEGVSVLVFDGGLVDVDHPDLENRVTHGETTNTDGTDISVRDHATHVAGTLGGDGGESAGEGGTVNQWRGMASEVNIISYAVEWDGTDLFLYDNLGDLEEDFEDAVNNHNVDIATASVGTNLAGNNWINAVRYSCNREGDYEATSQLIDNIIKGNLGRPLITTWSAGNERGPGTCGNTYGTICPPSNAKNPIHVGATNSNDNSITNFTGWGPTDDGRIKPTLVAPGCEVGNDGGITSTVPNLFLDNRNRNCADGVAGTGPNTDGDDYCYPYDVMCGTSMATPAVAGIASLLLQQYRTTYSTEERLLPSTVKALLIHTAEDLGNPGPDFQFGYGLVDAVAAVDMIRNGDPVFFESQINDPGEEEIFLVDVPAGQAELNVTLAWDDAPGLINTAPELQNDLDLELEAPDGTISSPWILDPTAGNEANNATTGVDDLNNQEQVHVANPAEGTWKIRITGNTVPEPIQKYSIVSDLPLKFYQNVSVVQVIDRTGSMISRDNSSLPTYMESAKIAAQNFIGLMQLGDEVGVVSFDQHGTEPLAQNIFELEELTNERMRNNAISSIDPLTARGLTSIGAGLQLAQSGPNYLDAANEDNPHAMVLLTDGFENYPPWVRERPDDYSYRPATPDNVLLSIPEKTDIYTITLGSSADETLLRDIANTTGGKSYNSPTILGLLSIYYQIQGDLELGETTDMAVGTKQGGNDTRFVIIDEGASEATFALGWLQYDGDLRLTLKDPNGNDVSPQSLAVNSIAGSTFNSIRIKNPMEGKWEAHITRVDSGLFDIDYTFAAFVKDVSKLWSFIPTFEEAGNCLMTKVQLYNNIDLQPITGANVEAVVTSPKTSVYTLHYNYVKPKNKTWNPGKLYSKRLLATSGSEVQVTSAELPTFATTLNQYNMESLKQTGRSIFEYNSHNYTLYDDGINGDEMENDGIYTYCIPNSEIAGSYNISFKISGITPSGSNFSRSLLATSLIQPTIADPSEVMVRVDPNNIPVKEGSEAVITVVPIDKYGNLLGPGKADIISVTTSAGELSGDILDNGDGIYLQKIVSKGTAQSGNIEVTIDGTVANSKPKFDVGQTHKKFDFSLHGGYAMPMRALADSFDAGLNVLVDLSYSFSPRFSLVAYFGYNDFKSKLSGIDDNYWLNISLNAKYRGSITPSWYYYLQAGPGYYIPEKGDSEFGANVGAGFDYDFRPFLTFELGTDYHTLFSGDVQFWHVHAGMIFRF